MDEKLFLQAVALAKSGGKEQARRLFQELLQVDRENELVWLWYAECAESTVVRMQILESCVRANPQAKQAWLLLTELRRTNLDDQTSEHAAPTQPVKTYQHQREEPAAEKPCLEAWKETGGEKVFTVSPDCLSNEEFKQIEEITSESLKDSLEAKVTHPEVKKSEIEHRGPARRKLRSWNNKEDHKVLFSVPNFGWYGR